MTSGHYTALLNELFDVLGLTEGDRMRAEEIFKHKLAFELLNELSGNLTSAEREWLDKNRTETDMNHPMIQEIREHVAKNFTTDELTQKTRPIFKRLLKEYLAAVTKHTDEATAKQLKKIVARFK